MANYFREPSTFRSVNCKKVNGERARKNCRNWNKLVKMRSQAIKAGDQELVEEIEQAYFNSETCSQALRKLSTSKS